MGHAQLKLYVDWYYFFMQIFWRTKHWNKIIICWPEHLFKGWFIKTKKIFFEFFVRNLSSNGYNHTKSVPGQLFSVLGKLKLLRQRIRQKNGLRKASKMTFWYILVPQKSLTRPRLRFILKPYLVMAFSPDLHISGAKRQKKVCFWGEGGCIHYTGVFRNMCVIFMNRILI